MNIHINEDHLNTRIENSLQRIDDKFSKLNLNLKRYSDIMGPAKNELLFEKGISPNGIPRIPLEDKSRYESKIY